MQVAFLLPISDFNPRSSCEERQDADKLCRACALISIHAPHARSDKIIFIDVINLVISIHAPHARSDDYLASFFFLYEISIHAPHARSDDIELKTQISALFQSTLLMRGATP